MHQSHPGAGQKASTSGDLNEGTLGTARELQVFYVILVEMGRGEPDLNFFSLCLPQMILRHSRDLRIY